LSSPAASSYGPGGMAANPGVAPHPFCTAIQPNSLA